MEKEFKVELGFVQRVLPWIVGAIALALYLATLNHSATFAGLSKLAQVAGWDWRPTLIAPLHYLLTLPVRWLPAGWQLVALNLISAVCSAAALALLARSVALLPHDRTREQRQIERNEFSLLSMRTAWLPPVMAALVCGLQLSFWENAVVATGESLDLLLFAWLIHCLLQYRLDQNEARLSRFAFVYGLAITNNFAMLAFLPAFLVALAWIKGVSFFNWRFLLKMTALGLAGLLGYLILPAMNVARDPQGFDFWHLLVTHWSFQKGNLLGFPRYLVLLLSFTSLLPVLFIGIRWPAQFGDISPTGNALTVLMTHVIHGVFLVACLYVAFDPQFSPRSLGGGRYVLLPLYYLGALSIGYCVGYFLLVFGSKPPPQIRKQFSLPRRAANPLITVLIWVALVSVPAGLVARNLPFVWANTGTALGRLAVVLAESLPSGNSLVLSDDPFRLYALRWELEKSNRGNGPILLDTAALVRPIYHRYLNQRHPERWPQVPIEEQAGVTVGNRTLVDIVRTLAQRETIFYLHPSFGIFFEHFYQKPTNLVYRLIPYSTNMLSAPPMSAAEIQAQDAYWQRIKPEELNWLVGKAPPFTPPKKTPRSRRPIDTMEGEVAKMYSRSINHFGVELQRAGDFQKAQQYFDLALKLNDANAAAYINRDQNRLFQAGKPAGEKPSEGAAERLSFYSGWDALLAINGPFDEPSFSFLIAELFAKADSPRQAVEQLQRVLFFTPTNVAAQVALSQMCAQIPLSDKALEMAAAARAQAGPSGLTEEQLMTLIEAEAWAYTFKNDLAAADKLLREARVKYPAQIMPWTTQVEIYLRLNRSQEALDLLKQQLQAQPTNAVAMVNYAYILIQNQQFTNAITYLDRALKLRPRMVEALLNRAIANLRSGRLDDALNDYKQLDVTMSSPSHEVYYGLGEAYFQKKHRKLALESFEKYLKLAPAGLPERRFVEDRIKALESGDF